MTNLTVWRFPDLDGGIRAEREAAALSAVDRLPINDAALVLWPAAAPAPHTRTAGNIAHLAPLDEYFWGLLFGLVFAAPLLGRDDIEPSCLEEVGIDAAFTRALRADVGPGASALVAVTHQEIAPDVAEQVAGATGRDRISFTRLSTAHSSNLHRVFGR